jgi:hypothetical protein
MSARARAIWRHLEAVHAVTYFAPACLDRIAELGVKGFWMGYFAARSAPLGMADPAVVDATFYNFAPRLVHRALPDAWSYTTPAAALDARAGGAAVALRQTIADVDETAARVVPLLETAARAAHTAGRTLAAANQALAARSDPVERLWQACTTLREHRGDGHVAALVCGDIGPIDAHLLAIRARTVPAGVREARGWTQAEWDAAEASFDRRDEADWALAHAQVEQTTDELAFQPYRDGLTDAGLELLEALLPRLSEPLLATGVLPFPNPIGLPER